MNPVPYWMKYLGTAVCVLEMFFFVVILFKSGLYTFTIFFQSRNPGVASCHVLDQTS